MQGQKNKNREKDRKDEYAKTPVSMFMLRRKKEINEGNFVSP